MEPPADWAAGEGRGENGSPEAVEQRPAETPRAIHALRLFVAGSGFRSVRAIANTKGFCEKYLGGSYDLEIVDIYQQPGLAAEADVVAVPVLIKLRPLPVQKFIGDLSNTRRLLAEFCITVSQPAGRDDERTSG